MARVLLTGGSGRLGQVIQRFWSDPDRLISPTNPNTGRSRLYDPKPLTVREVTRGAELIAPSRADFDVVNIPQCLDFIRGIGGVDVIIHAAGLISVTSCDLQMERAVAVNVGGATCMSAIAAGVHARLVYISTEYVFNGVSGHYHEDVATDPRTIYGETKAFAERLVRARAVDHLILRAAFRTGPPWPYDNAFGDMVTSAEWAPDLVPSIIEAALSDVEGTLHMGGAPRTLYEFARRVSPGIRKSSRKEWAPLLLPENVSLNCGKWYRLLADGKLRC